VLDRLTENLQKLTGYKMHRRQFLQALSLMGFNIELMSCSSMSTGKYYYSAPDFGNITLCHMTDCHAQLLPMYYREPSTNAVVNNTGSIQSTLSGQAFLKFFGIKPNSKEAYAFTHVNFAEAAKVYGKMGGFAYIATLIKQIKQASTHGNFLLLDGGDTWQGSATALWTQGRDMLAACNLLGVDIMTGHWEFTYGDKQVLENLKAFNGDFIAQNITLSDEALFNINADNNAIFKPYTLREFNGINIAVIGQAYPYTPIANPKYLIPDWQFGIQEQHLQTTVNLIKQQHAPAAIVLLSHNGLAIDLKLAARVNGIDIILGGHTHDALPKPIWVSNDSGRTCVTNAGSHGKFVAVVDLDIRQNSVYDLRYRLVPVFANLLAPDADMQALIDKVRQPYLTTLQIELGIADKLLYRRDTYQGTFDDVLLAALLKVNQAEIALSPGFRWGTTLLPGQPITMEEVMNHTAITYPNTVRRNLTGSEIKATLEDVADNVFNPDPYYQQGGDMVRVGGMTYRCDPTADMGQRISAMRSLDGKLIDPSRTYSVASWASVQQQADGSPMFDVVKDYLSVS
jgi:sulfur-oxidizing protein SoxB